MIQKSYLAWLTVLDEEDILFLKNFLLSSGSLKQMAMLYGVSYPTIRGRIDRMIEKVLASEAPPEGDSFENLVDVLVDQAVVPPGTARTLVQGHRRVLRDVSQRVERSAPPEPDAWHL